MMQNPFAKIMQRHLEAIIKETQEELGRISQQLIQGLLPPDMLASLMNMMQQSLGAMGFDISKLPGMMSQHPAFDPYVILGLDKSATDEEVKQAYRELVNQYHPDKSGTPRTKFAFQMVLAAYEFIKRERGWQ